MVKYRFTSAEERCERCPSILCSFTILCFLFNTSRVGCCLTFGEVGLFVLKEATDGEHLNGNSNTGGNRGLKIVKIPIFH
jgi:hypothetical protein